MMLPLWCVDLEFEVLPCSGIRGSYRCPQTDQAAVMIFDLIEREIERMLSGQSILRFFACECGRQHWAAIRFEGILQVELRRAVQATFPARIGVN